MTANQFRRTFLIVLALLMAFCVLVLDMPAWDVSSLARLALGSLVAIGAFAITSLIDLVRHTDAGD